MTNQPLPLLQVTRRPFGGMRPAEALAERIEEVARLYQVDSVPWVVGFSAGKDSTLALQMVWWALQRVPPQRRTKPVYVTSTDTGVENPLIARLVAGQHELLARAAEAQGLPVQPRVLRPAVKDTFWVNLIGRGMAAPRPRLRWCTDRVKIRPNTGFIREVVAEHGESVLVLGTRKAESTARAASMKRAEARGQVGDRLTVNGSLPNGLVYTPIEDLSTEEVWAALLDTPNPWGADNRQLMSLYAGATDGGECPVVVDTSTSACGSRFGCWTCTMVEQDKSLTALIDNGGGDLDWLLPLRDLRDDLDVEDDRHLREYVRARGNLTLHRDRLVHGQYTEAARHHWLARVLEAQEFVREHGPEWARDLELITEEELQEIRRLWVFGKHELQDALPGIFASATGRPYPGPEHLDWTLANGAELLTHLREVCGNDDELFAMTRDLLGVERQHRTSARRSGLFADLERTIARHFYTGEDDALQRARMLAPPEEPDPQQTLFDVEVEQPDPLLTDQPQGMPPLQGPCR